MSMLEDLFLEDEAGEAQELERVIEGGGDEYDERPISPTSDNDEEKDDEAVEDKRRIDPTQTKVKRVTKNPRFVLNPARLTGPRGIHVIPDHFKDFKFKGKGHEKEDLDMVLKKLEHWAYRLYPKFAFHDCLKKIEMLGKKRSVMVHLKQIRSDQLVSEETVVQKDSSDDEAPQDEFDKLLQQQIELARAAPAPPRATEPAAYSTPRGDRSHIMPKATSSPSISVEQRERMLRNRQLAEERRLAKLRNENSYANITSTPETQTSVEKSNENRVVEIVDEVVVRKHNRSNVIDSSDEEEVAVVNESITVDVDVHKKSDNITQNDIEVERREGDKGMDVIVATEVDKEYEFDKLITSDEKHSNVITDDTKKQNEIKHLMECEKENDNEIHDLELNSNDKVVDQQDDSNVDNDTPRNVTECYIDQLTNNVEEIINDINGIEPDVTVNASKDVSVCNSNKENIDSNIAEDIMDIDFSDDF